MPYQDVLQDHRVRPFWWASNKLVDKYLRLLSLEAFCVYCVLARCETDGSGHVEGDIRRIVADRMPATEGEIWEALAELERWHLVRFTRREDGAVIAYDVLDIEGEED